MPAFTNLSHFMTHFLDVSLFIVSFVTHLSQAAII